MATPVRRYIFIDYENLQRIRFRKLEKVCEKVFIFISAAEERIPVSLVQQIQKLGKNAKWMVTNVPANASMNLHICFLMGRLHEKVEKDIEFAILSDDADFDHVIPQINSDGRQCLRVKRPTVAENGQGHMDEDSYFPTNEATPQQASQQADDVLFGNEEVEDTEEIARDTVRWLIRSGNRPVALASLKSYILMQHKDDVNEKNVDSIISSMITQKEISVQQGEVMYNF